MFSKRQLEGELIIDHRSSPGTTSEFTSMPVPGGRMLETSTITCNHCQRIVVKNPYRIRERNYCPSCDRYICDYCEAERVKTGVCKPFDKFADEYLNNIAKGITNNG